MISFIAIECISTKSIRLIFSERVEVIREYSDKVVRTVSEVIKVPAVIRLLTKFKLRTHVKLSRKNILIRDSYRCKYCGKSGTSSSLTLDHILPKSRGGKFTWENIVTSCWTCNSEKGDRTPSEAGMKIQGGLPQKMEMFEYIYRIFEARYDVAEWQDFLVKKQ